MTRKVSFCIIDMLFSAKALAAFVAGVAELADAQDLKSCGTYLPYRFDSGRRHRKRAVVLLGTAAIFDIIKLLLDNNFI